MRRYTRWLFRATADSAAMIRLPLSELPGMPSLHRSRARSAPRRIPRSPTSRRAPYWRWRAARLPRTCLCADRRNPGTSRTPGSRSCRKWRTPTNAFAYACALRPVSCRIIGESTASTCRSTYDNKLDSIIATEGTHMIQLRAGGVAAGVAWSGLTPISLTTGVYRNRLL